MARWSNGEIEWTSGTLTTNYADNEITAFHVRQGWLILYVTWNKGSEPDMFLQFYTDNSDREVLGVETWFPMSNDGWWPVEQPIPMDVAQNYVDVRPQPFKFLSGGNHRITIMKFPREDAIKAAVKSSVAGTGTVTLRFATDEISWGGVGQGSE